MASVASDVEAESDEKMGSELMVDISRVDIVPDNTDPAAAVNKPAALCSAVAVDGLAAADEVAAVNKAALDDAVAKGNAAAAPLCNVAAVAVDKIVAANNVVVVDEAAALCNAVAVDQVAAVRKVAALSGIVAQGNSAPESVYALASAALVPPCSAFSSFSHAAIRGIQDPQVVDFANSVQVQVS